jgi:hypothetical protein
LRTNIWRVSDICGFLMGFDQEGAGGTKVEWKIRIVGRHATSLNKVQLVHRGSLGQFIGSDGNYG